MSNTTYSCILTVALAAAGCVGCDGESASRDAGEVIVYTALDRQFSEPILAAFTEQTGIRARAVYDSESTKTVGLVNRIRAEAARPRCDVFWNNEILNTLLLKSEGLLQPSRPPRAEHYPVQFRDPAGYWHGFAARARVLIVNTNLVANEDMPASIRDLADPRWRGKIGIAKPLFGTTASHVACLFAQLGEVEAKALLQSFKDNDIRVVGGNKTCAEQVSSGQLAFGLTDTDDALIEIESGKPVRMVFPDAGPDDMGTPVLPNTLAVVAGAPHADAAERLIDYLLSPQVEELLAEGPSGQIPLNPQTKAKSRAGTLETIKPMPIDFARAAEAFPAAAKYIEEMFLE